MSSTPVLDQTARASELVAHYAEHVAGKNILVTGVTPGSLGDNFVTAVAAARPNLIVLTGRDPAKFQSVVDSVKKIHPSVTVKSLTMDHKSLASVRAAAQALNEDQEIPHLDVAVLNAGIMAVPYSLTEDGFESQFQVNHLSHFLFTNLIMDKILASPGQPRVVSVSSSGHLFSGVRWADYNYSDGKLYDAWRAYGQSKTANNLMAVGLARRLGSKGKGLYAFSLHPGLVLSTGLAAGPMQWSSMEDIFKAIGDGWDFLGSRQMKDPSFAKDADQGPATHVYAAFHPELARPELNGTHLLDCHVAKVGEEEVAAYSIHEELADKLWELSEKLVGQEFSY